jgi:hypothetical protein
LCAAAGLETGQRPSGAGNAFLLGLTAAPAAVPTQRPAGPRGVGVGGGGYIVARCAHPAEGPSVAHGSVRAPEPSAVRQWDKAPTSGDQRDAIHAHTSRTNRTLLRGEGGRRGGVGLSAGEGPGAGEGRGRDTSHKPVPSSLATSVHIKPNKFTGRDAAGTTTGASTGTRCTTWRHKQRKQRKR